MVQDNDNSTKSKLPTSFGILLFPTFEALDAFGPLNCLNDLSRLPIHNDNPITLSIIASTIEPVSTQNPSSPSPVFGQSVLPTHTLDNAPPLDVLLVPGGMGLFKSHDDLAPLVHFIKSRYPTLHSIISICNGASLLALSGVLNGKRATTNKKLFREITQHPSLSQRNIQWVKQARWVEDGNIWTSSGVSAGVDVTLAWIGRVYGEDVARVIAEGLEYTRQVDSGRDEFAQVWGLV
ncbi:MAG: hypothetical protein Q9209_005944 [Squamulea sp. 1 TL-2023]